MPTGMLKYYMLHKKKKPNNKKGQKAKVHNLQ